MSANPAEACPSFHCRPSTVSTFLSRSLSMRHTPTTLVNAFGSAPMVSLVKSILVDGAAIAEIINPMHMTLAMPISVRKLGFFIAGLLGR